MKYRIMIRYIGGKDSSHILSSLSYLLANILSISVADLGVIRVGLFSTKFQQCSDKRNRCRVEMAISISSAWFSQQCVIWMQRL